MDDADATASQQSHWAYLATSYCSDSSKANLSPMQPILVNSTSYIRRAPSHPQRVNLQVPIYIKDTKVDPNIKTMAEFDFQVFRSVTFGTIFSMMAIFLVLFGAINNATRHVLAWMARNRHRPLACEPRWAQWLRQRVINPALLPNGRRMDHATWFGFLMVNYPSRLESMVLTLFITLNIVLLFPSYHLFADNSIMPGNTSLQLARYIAERGAQLSFSLLPMIYLFGGRNNILLWVTGWTYERFIVMHKWSARMMVFQAIVHSIACTWYTIHLTGWQGYCAKFQDDFFVWGVVATCVGCYILLMAMPNLRRAVYDLFLACHIVFVALFTIACWYHVQLIDDQMNVMFLYVSVGVWSFDRVVRLVRVLYLNVMLGIGRTGLRRVQVQAMHGHSEVLRITMDADKLAPFGKTRCLPGAYIYMYVPSVYFWQSHPFSVGPWHRVDADAAVQKKAMDFSMEYDNDDATTFVSRTTTFTMDSTSSHSTAVDGDMVDVPLDDAPPKEMSDAPYKDTFDLLIRPQGGMTRKLHDMVSKAPGCAMSIYALIEGPYGHFEPVLQYDTAIFVTGGVGCTATVPYLQYAVHHANKIAARRIVFYWTLQYEEQLTWAMQDVIDCLRAVNDRTARLTASEDDNIAKVASLAMDISIYVTRTKKPGPYSHDMDVDDEKELHGLTMTYGSRPKLDELVANVVDTAPGSVAMLYCGSSGMSDSARKITAQHGIPYFEEAFKW
ncbi:ferric reductase like transmembrane component-domain-containing protein [Gongronella butleri]|nr:ferric reductase like transmembrane component-domain-containing protein [Gongronella butleri]